MANIYIYIRNIWRSIYGRPLVWDAIATTIWNTLGKGLGLLVPFFIAAWFGVGLKTDIFFFVYGFTLYLTNIFAISLESNIVPFVNKIKSDQLKDVPVFINRLLSLVLLVTVILTVISIIVAKPIFSVITHFPKDSQGLLFRLFIEVSPLVVLVVISSILAGVLNAYFKFWLPAISPGIRAFICVVTIFILKDRLGINAVAVGYLLGEITRILILLYILVKDKIISFKLDFHFDSELINFFKILSFQIISMVAIGLNPIIDKAMASWLDIGSVSVLQYADRIYMIPIIFVSSGVIVVILSHWSDSYYRHKKIEALRKDMHKAMGVVAIISIILTFLLSIFSKQIVNLAYRRGEFPIELIDTVRSTFLFYLSGITFYLVGQIIVRAHLVLKNTRTLMYTAFIANISNIILNLILMHLIGVGGLALATTIASAITLFYLYWSFEIIRVKELVSNAD